MVGFPPGAGAVKYAVSGKCGISDVAVASDSDKIRLDTGQDLPVVQAKKQRKRRPKPNLAFRHKVLGVLREVVIIILFAVSGYVLACLLTYSPADLGPARPGGGEVANMGGPVGAWIADRLFTLFGRGAYALLFFGCLLAWRAYQSRGSGQYSGWNLVLPTAGFFAAMSGVCGLEQMYFPFSGDEAVFHAGGLLGRYGAEALALNFGVVGTTVILIALVIIGMTLIGYISWFDLMDRVGYRTWALVGWAKYRLEVIRDRNKGARVRRERQVNVKEIRATLSKKDPPKIAPRIQPPAQSARKQQESQASLFAAPDSAGGLPELSLLDSPTGDPPGYSRDMLESMSRLLVKKLKDFNVDVTVEAVQPGPIITRFEIEPAPGIKASQIVGLSRDLARSLSVVSVRVVENIPGKTVIGIEIPNQNRETVRLVEGLSSVEYEKSKSPLTLVLGKDIAGKPVITDLVKMPHILIAGTTGSGKSVCINALIVSLLYKSTPEQVRMIMVDPKFLELSGYDGIPHLLTPVVVDMSKAANALRWCVAEMDRRFRLMASLSVRNISGFNKKVAAAQSAGEVLYDTVAEVEEGGQPDPLGTLPYIVVVVDELADLMMVAGKKIEEIIIRIAQRARAAGIHLVLATQRPSVDVVTGLIKANVPTRIAFQVSSRADSRTVLDQMGAEQLLGQGDMLFLPPGTGFTQRVHGSFVSDEEVAKIVKKLKKMAKPVYLDEVISGDGDEGGGSAAFPEEDGESDPLYDEAVSFVTQSGKASISSVQRALRVGYNRAARMIETMEQAGVISSAVNGKREVIAPAPPDR